MLVPHSMANSGVSDLAKKGSKVSKLAHFCDLPMPKVKASLALCTPHDATHLLGLHPRLLGWKCRCGAGCSLQHRKVTLGELSESSVMEPRLFPAVTWVLETTSMLGWSVCVEL